MRIEFVIEELVLFGFDPRERHRIADAVERSLSRRVRAGDVLPLARAGAAVPALRGEDVVLPPTAGRQASVIGTGVAASIATGLAAFPARPGGGG